MTRSRVALAILAGAAAAALIVAAVVRNRGASTAPAPATATPPTFAPPGYGEKVRKIAALLEEAPASRPSASDSAEVLDLALHDPEWRVRVRAIAVLPFVGDREKAIDVLVACVHDRGPASSGDGNLPLYATTYLADMNATRAIPDVEDWIAYLEKNAPYDEATRAMMLKKGREDLARLKQATATRPAA